MLREFLDDHRTDLIARCAAKVARRLARNASPTQLSTGIPMFLDQLIQTLDAENDVEKSRGTQISVLSGSDSPERLAIGVTAAAHGKALFALNYTVGQVVHDYGDLCQAVGELAHERDETFSVEEYRTLNRCLDDAIADAVTEFSAHRDIAIEIRQTSAGNLRVGNLMHELRNALSSASLAAEAMRLDNLSANGKTSAVLKRSHATMARLINRSLDEVKSGNAQANVRAMFSVKEFVDEAHEAGLLDAEARGLKLVAFAVDPNLAIEAHRDVLLGALANLIGNALKFTLPHTTVSLSVIAAADRLLIEVSDHCGGLRPGDAQRIFIPFSQRGQDKTGVGLGLSIARESIRDHGGTLTVRDLPGKGCVFTINLPLRYLRNA